MEFSSIHITMWFIFVQLFLFSSTSTSSSSLPGNEVDRLSLLAFKAEIVNNTRGILSSWNESLDFCEWRGITCGQRHHKVTVLDLRSSALEGQLSPHIGNLSFLKTLRLENNSFGHTIPSEISRLFRLQQTRLYNNSFNSAIPSNISRCSNLQYLLLYGNNLSGKLPTKIATLSKLRVLDLGSNNFSGQILPSFGNLSSLEKLYLDHNNLHGVIPNSLGQLKNLAYLVVGTNNLNGTIAPSIYNLSSITYFSMLINQLRRTLPPSLGHTIFPNIEKFYCYMNQFSGRIPVSVTNASNLMRFVILDNKFTGKVPSLAGMSNLVWLGISNKSLGYNQEGDLDFLYSLVNCTNLQILPISDNNFGGVLPESLRNLSTTVKQMIFGMNWMHGNVPVRGWKSLQLGGTSP